MENNTVGKQPSTKGEMYREFFQPLVDTMVRPHGFSPLSVREDKNYRDFRTGHSGAVYGANFHGRTFHKGVCIAVCVYLNHREEERNKWLFDQLRERKDSIESRLGKLDWARLDGSDGRKPKKACRISAIRDGTIEDASRNPKEVRKWMIDRLLAFEQVFGPMLDGLAK